MPSWLQEMQGELLLFTDGDSVHATDAWRDLSTIFRRRMRILLPCAWNYSEEFLERLLQPPIFLLIMILVGGNWLMMIIGKMRLEMGSNALSSKAYDKNWGTLCVRDKIIEDLFPRQIVEKAGMRLRFVTASDALGVRDVR